MQWMREHQGRKSPHRSPFENYLHQLMKCAALTALTRYLLRILRCIFEILKYLHSNSKSSPSEALPSQAQQSKGRGRLVNFESLPDQRFTGKTIGKIILPVKTGKLQFFKISAKNNWKLCQAPFWSIWEINVHTKTPHFLI